MHTNNYRTASQYCVQQNKKMKLSLPFQLIISKHATRASVCLLHPQEGNSIHSQVTSASKVSAKKNCEKQ